MLSLQLVNAILILNSYNFDESKNACFVFQLWKLFQVSTTWQSLDYSKKIHTMAIWIMSQMLSSATFCNIYIIVT